MRPETIPGPGLVVLASVVAAAACAIHVDLPPRTAPQPPPGGPAALALATPCAWLGVGKVTDLAFTRDGRTLAVAGGHFLKMFDAGTGAPIRASRWQPADLVSAAFSADGAMAGSVSDRRYTTIPEIRLWRTATGEEIAVIPIPLTGQESFSASSKNGQWIATRTDGKLTVTATPTGATVATMSIPYTLATVSFSADDRFLMSRDGAEVRVWQTDTWAEVVAPLGVVPLASRPKGSSGANAVYLNQIATNTGAEVLIPPERFAPPAGVDLVTGAISDDGTLVAGGSDKGQVFVWRNDQASTRFLDLAAQSRAITALAFSPDGSSIAASSDDGSLVIWRVRDGSVAWQVAGPLPDGPRLVRATDDGARVVVGGSDVVVVDAQSGAVIRRAAAGGPCGASADARVIACSNADSGVTLVDASGASRPLAAAPRFDVGPSSVAVSPDGRFVAAHGEVYSATFYGDVVRLWDASSSTARELALPTGSVVALEFTPDSGSLGALVIDLAGPHTVLRLWKTDTGAVERDFAPFAFDAAIGDALAFSHDGAMVLTRFYSEQAITAWPLAGGDRRDFHLGAMDRPTSDFVFSPDDSLIATNEWLVPSGPDRGTVVYRASDRAAVWTIAGPADGVAFLGNTKVVREEDEGAASVWCPTPSP